VSSKATGDLNDFNQFFGNNPLAVDPGECSWLGIIRCTKSVTGMG